MKCPRQVAATAILATMVVPSLAIAQDAPAPARYTVAAARLNRDQLDVRAVHLARAALEGQQVQELSREELVSLLVLMSLPPAPRHHS
jgi:hypothetical protein